MGRFWKAPITTVLQFLVAEDISFTLCDVMCNLNYNKDVLRQVIARLLSSEFLKYLGTNKGRFLECETSSKRLWKNLDIEVQELCTAVSYFLILHARKHKTEVWN